MIRDGAIIPDMGSFCLLPCEAGGEAARLRGIASRVGERPRAVLEGWGVEEG